MNRSIRKVARALILVGAVAALLPAAAQAYVNAGFRSRAEYEAYLKEKERREHPREPGDFYDRGCCRGTTGLWERAIDDFDQAIRLSPEFARAFVARGTVRWKQEEYAKAIADYQEAVRLDPRATPACLRLAAAYGACPEAKLRSPARAIATAKRACELSGYRDPDCVQVLAALHAQAGDFEAAVKWQCRVVAMPLSFGAQKAEQRLEQYRQRKSPEWDLERDLTGAAVLKE